MKFNWIPPSRFTFAPYKFQDRHPMGGVRPRPLSIAATTARKVHSNSCSAIGKGRTSPWKTPEIEKRWEKEANLSSKFEPMPEVFWSDISEVPMEGGGSATLHNRATAHPTPGSAVGGFHRPYLQPAQLFVQLCPVLDSLHLAAFGCWHCPRLETEIWKLQNDI